MKLKRRNVLIVAISLGVTLLCLKVYSAATTDILVSGTIADSQVFNGPATLTVRLLTLKPGDKLPWHYHPGYAFNVVKSGTLTVEDGCGGAETLNAGQGFEEIGRVHRGRNLSDRDVVVYDTFLIAKDEPTTVNIPGDEPRCGPPRSVKECENGGWRKFNHPQSFTDESQCANFFLQKRRTVIQFPKPELK